jgi:alpha-beta hydrolase superfamily lysophospholipase
VRIRLGSKGSGGGFDFEAMRCLGLASMGGAGVGECLAAIQRIRRGDVESWTSEFGALADRLVREAKASLEGGDPVSAAEQLQRASTYYRTGAFYLSAEGPRQHRYRRLSREVFHQALACVRTRTEIVEIAFEGAILPGYFVSAGPEPSPTLLILGGYDSTAEELMLWLGNACGARGWNALVFEGPGQPGALNMNPGLVFRPDYEAPVGAAIDYALSRPDVDAQRLALIGYSFGGYLAPRAAACDPRIRAVIADTIGVNIAGAMRMAIPAIFWKIPDILVDFAFEALTRVDVTARFFFASAKEAFGITRASEFLRAWEPYNLWSVRDKLTVPLLVMITEDEIAEAPRAMIDETFDFLRGLNAPVSLRAFSREEGATAHCQLDSPERMPPVLFSWLNQVFGADPSSDAARQADSGGFEKTARLVKKHHGVEFAPFENKRAADA